LKQQLEGKTKEEKAAILKAAPHESGFGKPPKAGQFKPGNKQGRGRRKGSQNLSTIYAEEFDAKVPVNKNGRVEKMSIRRLGMRHVALQVAQGKIAAVKLMVQLDHKYGSPANNDNVADQRDIDAVANLAALMGDLPQESSRTGS
jgi:hypothetical protein